MLVASGIPGFPHTGKMRENENKIGQFQGKIREFDKRVSISREKSRSRVSKSKS